MGLEILLENCFLYFQERSRSSPASWMSPFSNALVISTAISLDLSRASSFWPALKESTWLSMILADSLGVPV